MSIKKVQADAKNQIIIGKMGKENVIANGKSAMAIGKNVKTTAQKSIFATIVQAFLSFFKLKWGK